MHHRSLVANDPSVTEPRILAWADRSHKPSSGKGHRDGGHVTVDPRF